MDPVAELSDGDGLRSNSRWPYGQLDNFLSPPTRSGDNDCPLRSRPTLENLINEGQQCAHQIDGGGHETSSYPAVEFTSGWTHTGNNSRRKLSQKLPGASLLLHRRLPMPYNSMGSALQFYGMPPYRPLPCRGVGCSSTVSLMQMPLYHRIVGAQLVVWVPEEQQ